MADETWTAKRILDWIEGYLRDRNDENPRLAAQWLVSEALGVSRTALFMDLDRPLSEEERSVLRDYTRRRGAGEPLQYITGEAPFRHITVKVAPGVLIPRPETEVLVSEALALLPAPSKAPTREEAALAARFGALVAEQGREAVEEALRESLPAEEVESLLPYLEGEAAADQSLLAADICTGSGCIACSLASEYPAVRVVATDIAPEAAVLARQNAEALGLAERVEVLECDLGEGIDPALMGAFDLVVSNPPYVPTAVLAGLPREVGAYEPALALDGGPDGLDVFRRLLDLCSRALRSGGAFAFELHESCLDAAAAEASAAGFQEVRVIPDLAGRPRILTGRRACASGDVRF